MSRPQTPSYAVRRPPLNAALNTAVGSGISRGGSPSKPVITLDEWEFKAPLTDTQLQSIAVVKDKLGQRPLPKKVSDRSISPITADRSSAHLKQSPRLKVLHLRSRQRLPRHDQLESLICSTRPLLDPNLPPSRVPRLLARHISSPRILCTP